MKTISQNTNYQKHLPDGFVYHIKYNRPIQYGNLTLKMWLNERITVCRNRHNDGTLRKLADKEDGSYNLEMCLSLKRKHKYIELKTGDMDITIPEW